MGYEGLYEVSSFGNVRSLARMTLGRWGKMKLSPGGNLTAERPSNGYLRVQLSKEGTKKHQLVHRLVGKAFIKSNGKPHINHKDSDRANNHVGNLEWCTPRENTAHMEKQGRALKHKKHSDETALEVFRLRAAGLTYEAIGKELNMTGGHAWHIFTGRSRAKLRQLIKDGGRK